MQSTSLYSQTTIVRMSDSIRMHKCIVGYPRSSALWDTCTLSWKRSPVELVSTGRTLGKIWLPWKNSLRVDNTPGSFMCWKPFSQLVGGSRRPLVRQHLEGRDWVISGTALGQCFVLTSGLWLQKEQGSFGNLCFPVSPSNLSPYTSLFWDMSTVIRCSPGSPHQRPNTQGYSTWTTLTAQGLSCFRDNGKQMQ